MTKFIQKAISPLKVIIADSRFTGMLLLACTAVSLLLSNTGAGEWYRGIWNTEIHYPFSIHLPHSALKWINDFLMAIFFLFAGMEIKRELTIGELSHFKKAIMPLGAALGGMIVPALIYSSFNVTTAYSHGWGIPTATDIAFSIGIASLFGKRVPQGLKIFLMALAIIDDLGAIVVIALFYGNEIKWIFLLAGGIVYGFIWLVNYFKIKQGPVQVILSLMLWYLILNSGVEASISGVLIALTIPVNTLPKFELTISRFVSFIILPLFALANTAIAIPTDFSAAINNPISIGIVVGLVIGKPIGIFSFSRIMISLGLGRLPANTNLRQLLGIGSLAGIGFTMSIFTTTLAFHDEVFRDIAKISILAAMILSMILSWMYFRAIDKTTTRPTFKKEPVVLRPDLVVG